MAMKYQGKTAKQWANQLGVKMWKMYSLISVTGSLANAVRFASDPHRLAGSYLRGNGKPTHLLDGRLVYVSDVSKKTGIAESTIHNRMKRFVGPPEKALRHAIDMGLPKQRRYNKKPPQEQINHCEDEVTQPEPMPIIRAAINSGLVICCRTMEPVFAVIDCHIIGCSGGCFEGIRV